MLPRAHYALVAALLLTGCSAWQGRPRPYAVVGVASPARHNIEPRVGGELRWPGGAEVRALYEPWLRVEEPSSRGFPEEVGRFEIEASIPVGR